MKEIYMMEDEMIEGEGMYEEKCGRMKPAPRVSVRECRCMDVAFDFFAPIVRAVELSASPRWERQYIRPVPSRNGAWRSKITLRSGRSQYHYFEDGEWKRTVKKILEKK